MQIREVFHLFTYFCGHAKMVTIVIILWTGGIRDEAKV